MKKLIPIMMMALLFAGVGTTQAQTAEQPLGFKVKFGTQAYKGDLGNEILQYSDSDFLYGIGLSAYLNQYFDLALEAQLMTLDKVNGPNDNVYSKRNTSFKTSNLNVNLMLHFSPFETRLNPYLAAGVEGNVLKDDDNFRKDETFFAFGIPFGVGVNFQINDDVMLNVQAIYHRTFSDDIDKFPLSESDASTIAARGNANQDVPRKNIDKIDHDDFFTTSIGLVYTFGGGSSDEMSMEQKMLKQSMANLRAAQNTNNEASNTLQQAQQLNDETLAALDSLKSKMSQSKKESSDLKARMVHIVNNIQFKFDSADIIAPAEEELNSLADILQNYQNLNIDVSGYADSRGSDSYNQELSQKRAQAVKDYLTNQGVSGSRITTNAYGEDRQQMEGSSATSYAQNRSVRLTLTYNDNGEMNDNGMNNMDEDSSGY